MQLLQEWLAQQKEHLQQQRARIKPGSFQLLPHCTEQTNATASLKDWQTVFSALGLELEGENLGCCGMAGTYGHEAAHKETSRVIFQQSWAPKLNGGKHNQLATGYSCRCQASRFAGVTLRHPLQGLLAQLDI